MQRPHDVHQRRRDVVLRCLHEKNVKNIVKYLRKLRWPDRQLAFKSLGDINPRMAIDVELRMGPDELLDVGNVYAEPDAVIPLHDVPMTLPRLFARQVRQRLV